MSAAPISRTMEASLGKIPTTSALHAGFVFALGAASACAAAGPQPSPTPSTMAALPLQATRGRGAALPFIEYEAENGRTNGTLIGPDRTFTSIAAEASGRRAVRLSAPGQYVEFTLAKPANAVVVRCAVPDTPDGRGLDASLGVYVGQTRIAVLRTTSRYGWFYGRYPFTNRPSDGSPHHVFDEGRVLLGRTLPAGTRVRLMIGRADRAPWYVVDLADFELVPAPLWPPARALSVREYGADPTGAVDSSEAIQRAISAGRVQRRPVWLPPGTYRVSRHIFVDDVELDGAGVWYSVLTGPGVGIYGRMDGKASRRVILKHFAIMGEVTSRNDDAQVNGVGGAIGGGSEIDDLWIQHTKAGVWLQGPADGLRVRGLRILDLAADGLNLAGGVSHATVEDTFVRNSGDDGLAMWSRRIADHDDVFRRNTVIAPGLANGIAIYGGRDIAVEGNLVADTLTEGGGLHLGNRFSAIPANGTISFADDIVVRSGSFDPHWRFGVGALWFYALDAPLSARVAVRNTEIIDSSYEAIQFLGKSITGVRLDDVAIHGAGTFAVQLQAPGQAVFSHVTATGLGVAGVYDCNSGFVIARVGGNSGWSRDTCAFLRPAVDWDAPLAGQHPQRPRFLDVGVRGKGAAKLCRSRGPTLIGAREVELSRPRAWKRRTAKAQPSGETTTPEARSGSRTVKLSVRLAAS